MTSRAAGFGVVAVVVLLGAHLLLGVGRLPGKAWGRRLEEVERYRQQGAARFLFDSARLEGAEAIEWILQNVAEDAVVLWRWPAAGGLEFTAALIAPRLLVDDRRVPAGATMFAGRPLARGTVPGGASGVVVVQGTDTEGLRLRVRGQ